MDACGRDGHPQGHDDAGPAGGVTADTGTLSVAQADGLIGIGNLTGQFRVSRRDALPPFLAAG